MKAKEKIQNAKPRPNWSDIVTYLACRIVANIYDPYSSHCYLIGEVYVGFTLVCELCKVSKNNQFYFPLVNMTVIADALQ